MVCNTKSPWAKNLSYICYNWMPLVADHVVDLPNDLYIRAGTSRLHNADSFEPGDVKDGDLIFVKTDFIVNGSFRSRYMNKIDSSFNLITGASSYSLDLNQEEYQLVVRDSRLNKWFCTNPPLLTNEKLVSLPIGFQEPDRPGGNQLMLSRIADMQTPFEEKKDKIFLPYHDLTTNPARKQLVKKLGSLPFVEAQTTQQSLFEYYRSLDSYKFVIGIAGRGRDIHRNYETMLVGSIPISTNTLMWSSFATHDVNVVCLESWDDLDEIRYKKVLETAYNMKSNKRFLSLDTHVKYINRTLARVE